MKLAKFICVVTLLIIQGCTMTSEDSTFRDKLHLTTLQGEKVDLSEVNDQYLLVNFWATWCKPCIREMPALKELKQAIQDQNIKFIFVSNEDPDHVAAFLKKQNLEIESYIMTDAIEVYELLYLPTTFIVSPEGEVLLKKEGEQDWSGTRMIQEITALTSG